MKHYSMALYDAFTGVAFGGSQAAVIIDADRQHRYLNKAARRA